jgi:hypothetical protein
MKHVDEQIDTISELYFYFVVSAQKKTNNGSTEEKSKWRTN